MFRKILVPLDGSDLAERALRPALQLAEKSGAEVWLMRVPMPELAILPAPAEGFSAFHVQWHEQALNESRHLAQQYLDALVRSYEASGISLHAEVAQGDVAQAIVNTAADHAADLIVMSSHGYSGLSRWVYGSVAEKVLQLAPCPVLVVRSTKPLDHILIPLDGSGLSEQALQPGFETAAAFGARVMLFRAVPDMARWSMGVLPDQDPDLIYKWQQECEADAHAYLKRVGTGANGEPLQIDAVVGREPAAPAILSYAQRHGVSLIVMATHGRSGVVRWVYGSVTEKVVRAGDTSLLVVRPSPDDE